MADRIEEEEEDSLSPQEVRMFRRVEEFISSRGDSYQDLDLEDGVRAIASEADKSLEHSMDIFHAACEMRDALGVPAHEDHVGWKLKETKEWLKANAQPLVALSTENKRLLRVLRDVEEHVAFNIGDTDELRRIVASAFDPNGTQREEPW